MARPCTAVAASVLALTVLAVCTGVGLSTAPRLAPPSVPQPQLQLSVVTAPPRVGEAHTVPPARDATPKPARREAVVTAPPAEPHGGGVVPKSTPRCAEQLDEVDRLIPRAQWRIVSKVVCSDETAFGPIAVYADDDIVSASLGNRTCFEAPAETLQSVEDFWRLPQAAATPRARLHDVHAEGHWLIDVGANVGAYALTAAARGWRVLAVEAMPRNAALLNYSLCLSGLAQQVRLVRTAVGTGASPCYVFAPLQSNSGNGFVRCPATDEERANVSRTEGATPTDLVPLDTVVERAVASAHPPLPPRAFIKIDIEGYEYLALQSAPRSFGRGLFSCILTEIWSPHHNGGLLGGAEKYIDFLTRVGRMKLRWDHKFVRGEPPFELRRFLWELNGSDLPKNVFGVRDEPPMQLS
eukprot:TRINITY_DN10022_c0_g1_i2.p1 TRINITY_DN10022_c0_g1~~TRINITY_DN10022_c0_g1_i2.p1  ORF type:complete len:429 (+),score=87.32 TRINITY_DN10022_c0_g1_i2:55-1287(+)